MSIVLALGVGLLIGAVLGLLGAGGSLLTVPAMIFLLGLTTPEATGTSLVAVAMMAVSGMIVHRRAGRCSCREGLLFGAAAASTAVFAGLAASTVPEIWLTVSFIVLLLGTVVWLVRRDQQSDAADTEQSVDDRDVSPVRSGLAGAGVGVLTGLLGVGGGFIVVPALMATRRMPIALAVGTSQLVVFISAIAGLLGRIPGGTVQWQVGLLVGAGGLIGSAVGSRLADRAPDRALRRAFAAVATIVAVAMAAQAVAA